MIFQHDAVATCLMCNRELGEMFRLLTAKGRLP